MHEATRRDFLKTGAAAAAGLMLPGCGGPSDDPGDDPNRGGAASSGSAPETSWHPQARDALERGARWLWDQQSSSGAFESRTYGLLKEGQSLTPFTLLGLLQVPQDVLAVRQGGVRRALEAMVRMLTPIGALGLATPVPDYPCYASAMMLSCLGIVRPEGWEDAARPIVDWLRSQQLRKRDGWEEHTAQGGWGLGARDTRTPPYAGHVDLSMTRHVIEGIRSIGIASDDPALVEARDFVDRCQAWDGGFFYSPVELGLNKAGRDAGGAPKGYGSATGDGILCLLALGHTRQSPRMLGALQWLATHHRSDRNPGLLEGPMAPFAEAMRGYYRATAASCFALLDGPEGWRAPLAAAIAPEQRGDGSWQSQSPLQKEDDPIVATGFAVRALSALLH